MNFDEHFIFRLLADAYRFEPRNLDYLRDSELPHYGPFRRMKNNLLAALAKRGWSRRHFYIDRAAKKFGAISAHMDKHREAYALLCDDYSREAYVGVLSYRTLGAKHVRALSNPAAHLEARETNKIRYMKGGGVRKAMGRMFNRYEIDGKSGGIQVELPQLAFQHTFTSEQYFYRHGAVEIGAREGDVVLDGGGCWGDTALYFADRAGTNGSVFVFEFEPGNLQLLRHNLSLNPHLERKINIVERALWSHSDEELHFDSKGPGTRLEEGGAAAEHSVKTQHIDGLVQERGLQRVDFIKMDIEGAERAALRGAAETIKRWKPRLAITVYHHIDDFFEIPLYLASLGCGYRFYLDHFTIHEEETVLFAEAD